MIRYQTEIQGTDREIEDSDLVDMMKVRDKLRYADHQGGQGKLDTGRILEVKGDGHWEIIVRTPSGREEYSGVNVAVEEDGEIYLSGRSLADRVKDGEIIRARNLSA